MNNLGFFQNASLWTDGSASPCQSNEDLTNGILEDLLEDGSSKVCSICHQVFHDMRDYTVHWRLHQGIKPFICSKCDESFVSLPLLLLHKKDHGRGEIRRLCRRCDTWYASLPDYLGHLEIHARTELYFGTCFLFMRRKKLF